MHSEQSNLNRLAPKGAKVLITSNYAYPHIGGIENSIRHLAEEAQGIGDSVLIVSSDTPSSGSEETGDAYDVISKRKYRSFFLLPQPFRMFFSLISAVGLYRNIRRDFAPDFVIARYHFNVVAAWIAGVKPIFYLVPGVIKYQNSKLNMSSTTFLSGKMAFLINIFLQWLAFSVSSRIYVFSKSMGIQVRSVKPGVDIFYVKPGVDLRRFSMSIIDHKKANRINMICVGRLVAAKGFNYAIEALCFLPSTYELTIVGDGEERAALLELVEKLKLRDRVRFVSGVSNPEKYYAESHVFLMTSSYEPFGQTILEAGACGLPVVAYKRGESVDTSTYDILGAHAVYADDHTPESLSNAVQMAYAEYYIDRKKSRESIVRHVAANYSWQALYLELKGGAW
jgi:1,2-diacylglycerol 3-alpha-glucosyltransferase